MSGFEFGTTELALTSAAEWPTARRSLRKWLLRRDVPELLACDVVLVAEEALSPDGPMSITAETSAAEVVLTITGQGEIDPTGLHLTQAAAGQVDLVRADDHTTVTARFPLPRNA
jgi:hypothetical protein